MEKVQEQVVNFVNQYQRITERLFLSLIFEISRSQGLNLELPHQSLCLFVKFSLSVQHELVCEDNQNLLAPPAFHFGVEHCYTADDPGLATTWWNDPDLSLLFVIHRDVDSTQCYGKLLL